MPGEGFRCRIQVGTGSLVCLQSGAHCNGTDSVTVASFIGCICCLSLGFSAILAQLPHAPIGKGSILKALWAVTLHGPRSEHWWWRGKGGRSMSLKPQERRSGQEPGDTGTRESWLGKKPHSGRGGRGS